MLWKNYEQSYLLVVQCDMLNQNGGEDGLEVVAAILLFR